jgi:O-antigen ligase
MNRKLELALLVAFCTFLPLYEAPKTIFWLAWLLAWGINRARERDFGGPWDLWDTLVVAWIGSGFAVAAFAGLHGAEWRAPLDLVRYGGLLLAVRRTRYSATELRWVLGALVASTLVGLAMGYRALWGGAAEQLQLNSVGHVNHTAIYLAIMLGVCVSWLFAGPQRALAAAASLVVLVSVFVTASRSAVLAALVVLPILGAGWWPRSRMPLKVASVVALLAVAGAVGGGAEVIKKHIADVEAHNMLSFRDGIWRTGLAAFERFPLFGVGMDNYSRITPAEVKAWRQQAGEDFDPRLYRQSAHGHSLVFTTLAERGLVGAAALAAVLLAWLVFLVRRRPRAGDADELMVLWGAAAAAWLVTVIVGLVNTTLHHEHALLAVLLLGLWLSRLKAA